MKRHAVLVRALLLLALLATSAGWARGGSKAKAELNLEGTYTIAEGKAADGTTYAGTVTIERKKSEIDMVLWDLAWHLDGREKPIRGIGMLFEDQILCVAYGPNEDYGLVIFAPLTQRDEWLYKSDDLFGLWMNSRGTVGREALDGDVETYSGTYGLHGHTLSRTGPTRRYEGALEMTPTDEVLRFEWRWRYLLEKTDHTFSGIGLEVPGLLLGGWNLGDGGVGVYVIEGDRLVGLFAEAGGAGNEKLAIPEEVMQRIARRRP